MKSGPISILLLAVCLLVSPNLSAYAESCAKDMFFDQLESPEESINTGLKYWIQLRRNGKVSLVDNRTDFSSGDEIRFQVVPNIAGFAYVVLEKGSTGAKKVLFPNANEPSGKVLPGKQYLLPAKGFLRFDKNAGLETVRVVLSRNPVSEAKLLNGDLSKIVIAAKGTNPSQPIQNDNCLLAFSQAENKPVEFEESEGKGVSGFSKDLVYVPAQGSGKSKAKSRLRKSTRRSRGTVRKVAPAVSPSERSGSVTVINIEPEQGLIAEIQLKHI